ncbi:MAG TPA: ester cyclase [Acidimicrobiales bacterium]
MTITEQNKATVSRFIDALFTRGDLGAVDEYLAYCFVNNDPPFGASSAREGMRQAASMFRAVFPDWHSDLHLLVAEDDTVVEVFTASGTHTGGDIMGVKASGATVTLGGINVFRLSEGLIVERWGRLDDLGFMQQLGLVPVP